MAGLSAVLFDVEIRGKAARQGPFDTDITNVSLDDLPGFVAASGIRPICRLDGPHPGIATDIECAIECGVRELLFPMVRSVAEIDLLLTFVAGRVPVGIMIETAEILDQVRQVATLPLSRVYVGLNDLMISRRSASLFAPMIDGTVDRIREEIGAVPFGIAGATRVDKGQPIPFRLLLAELARLKTDFTILRRSFHRDVPPEEASAVLREIQSLWSTLRARSETEIVADRNTFVSAIAGLPMPNTLAGAARQMAADIGRTQFGR